ncbi:MAG: DUF3455 domain-containing protein [Xanthobacteraceae bacterium]|nr:DUF3455 domain-containing protein [Xanthobacteraceae bacterium]
MGPRHALILVVSVAALAGSVGSGYAQVPAAIAAPGEAVVASFHAEGAQVYECKAGNDGKLVWIFREPIAALILDGKTIGRHYAGPTWELADGSAVVGKVSGSAPSATVDDIAWLKLDVVDRRGSGTLTDVTTVQRINTRGGVMHGTCDQSGALKSAPYSADYVFLRKAG